MKAAASLSESKWPRTAASTRAAGGAGFQAGFSGVEGAHAGLEELLLAGGGPPADGEGVGEVAAIARDHDREIEQQQVARLDFPRGWRAALFDLAARAGCEVAVEDGRLAQLHHRGVLDDSIGVQLGHARLDLFERRRLALSLRHASSGARTSISSGSLARRSVRMIGAMSTISSPGRAERRPSMTPAGTLESSMPMRLPGMLARRFSVDSTSWRRRCGCRVVSVIPAWGDEFVNERAVEKWPEHVVGDQRRPVGLENEQCARLDRAEDERRGNERGEIDQMRGICDDEQVAFGRAGLARVDPDAFLIPGLSAWVPLRRRTGRGPWS